MQVNEATNLLNVMAIRTTEARFFAALVTQVALERALVSVTLSAARAIIFSRSPRGGQPFGEHDIPGVFEVEWI